MKETRIATGTWDLTAYRFKIDSYGYDLLQSGMKDKKILGVKCHQCGTTYVPGVLYCRKCFIDIKDVVEVGDRGAVMTYTVNYSDIQGRPLAEPSVSVQVKLDGADSWIAGTLRGVKADPEALKIGMRVKIAWKDEPSGGLSDMDHWEPE